MAPNAKIDQLFPTDEERLAFEKTTEFHQIAGMAVSLKARSGNDNSNNTEPIQVVTVRMAKSLHLSLIDEAARRRTSMNKLIVAKCLMALPDDVTFGR